MRIQFDIFGDKQVERDILRIGEHGGNLMPVFRALSKYFYSIERKQFASGGGFGSGGWPALKEKTIARKRAKNQDKGILRATDALMNSLTRPGATNAVRLMTQEELFLGTTDPKAIHHQFGAPAAGVPQRRVVEFRGQDRVQWIKMMQRYIITGHVPNVPAI